MAGLPAQMTWPAHEQFKQITPEQLDAFECRERQLRTVERKDRAARLHLPVDKITMSDATSTAGRIHAAGGGSTFK